MQQKEDAGKNDRGGEACYQKSDINIEQLLPTAEQGLAENHRINVLYDFKSDSHKKLKYYKKLFDEMENLRMQSIHYLGMKEEPYSVDPAAKGHRKTISFDQMFTFLKSDKNFAVQNSYDPANNIIYQATRNRPLPPDMVNKVSTFDLRDIFYRANDFNAQLEPKIVEKEIIERLNREEDLTVEQKLKLYEQLDILEDIKLKKTRTTDQYIRKVENQEIKRAEHRAHLAYHYQKLKKYMSEEQLDRLKPFININREKTGKFQKKQKEK